MEAIPLAEAIVAFIAGFGAWLSWKARGEAIKAGEEARGANRAVNCNEAPNAPRLYQLVADNAKTTAVIEERVEGIKERGKATERKVEVIVVTQAEHAEILKRHESRLERSE